MLKGSQNVSAFTQISNCIAIDERNIRMKAFIASQFSYYFLVWMFCSKKPDKWNKCFTWEGFKITYGDKTSSFNELLEKNNFVSIHHKNLEVVAIEICKISNNISPTTLNDIFAPSYLTQSVLKYTMVYNGIKWHSNSTPFRTKNMELNTTHDKTACITWWF